MRKNEGLILATGPRNARLMRFQKMTAQVLVGKFCFIEVDLQHSAQSLYAGSPHTLRYVGLLVVPPQYPTRVILTPEGAPRAASGCQNHPSAKVAVDSPPLDSEFV
eukprot:CAMPEP_0179426166 /NCGR_PEP_ID=MMETSP0799-20121207/12583_1 /TAXON_ID=46947 /ORGANISM="Geminigera cryophila, Strain CCMP2564" /LENGTH=105 /DNA_ID=CAMNT_0021200879 /DNA_START=512 /DNA_END=830 /DNA_ORIENTATION=+